MLLILAAALGTIFGYLLQTRLWPLALAAFIAVDVTALAVLASRGNTHSIGLLPPVMAVSAVAAFSRWSHRTPARPKQQFRRRGGGTA